MDALLLKEAITPGLHSQDEVSKPKSKGKKA
jgi:hypothetical protein